MLASMDVESLFTNVPVNETIGIILENVYENPNMPPLQLSRDTLEKLLLACTTESPFRGPDGQLYRQKDGIAMGSPLGPLFANFYMGELEKRILKDKNIAPHIYCRYVDDIFVDVDDVDHLKIIQKFESNSVLKFTFELSVKNKLPFLDVMVAADGNNFATSIYRKPTDAGRCLNGRSECPSRYKASVVKAFVRRAVKGCSSWDTLHTEFQRIKQLLVNNGYTNTEIDEQIKSHVERAAEQNTGTSADSSRAVNLFYRNHMSSAYKVDERIIHEIIEENVKCVNTTDRLQLIIYYKNGKTSNLLMQNNLNTKNDTLKRTNVVYQFSCPYEDCRLRGINYIGVTTTSLSRRLTMHLREGAPKQHMTQAHDTALTRTLLTANTTIIKAHQDRTRLWVLEALLIKQHAPQLNKQLNSSITLGLWR